MKDYNPKQVARQLNPEQKAIKDFRNTEYQRKYGIKSEDKVNQEHPNPQGIFRTQLQGLARKIVEGASDLTNKKKKGDIDNYKYAAQMAIIERSVSELGAFAKAAEDAMANYNENLKNGTLSYGMDQYDEGVLQGLNKGTINLELDKEGRAVLNGKATNPLVGDFDVNIYDVNNIPAPVPKIKPINLTLDPVAKELGLDENGQPLLKVDKFGNKMYDTGPYSDHNKKVLDFSQDALQTLGSNGVRSYLADHMQMPQSQVKAFMEEQSYTDPDGREWDNRGTAEAFASIYDYIGSKYNRQQKPHPDTISKLAKENAQRIAAKKGISPTDVSFNEAIGIETPTPGGGEVIAEESISEQPVQQPAVPMNPVQKLTMLDATTNPAEILAESKADQGVPEENVEINAEELIKKYS